MFYVKSRVTITKIIKKCIFKYIFILATVVSKEKFSFSLT